MEKSILTEGEKRRKKKKRKNYRLGGSPQYMIKGFVNIRPEISPGREGPPRKERVVKREKN